jgi:hypothetical protein
VAATPWREAASTIASAIIRAAPHFHAASGTSRCIRRETSVVEVDDDAIRAVVTRLARPHSSGGKVIMRAAILAEGTDSAEIMAWITAHAGVPEATLATPSRHGLHGSRQGNGGGAESQTSPRFVLPAGALA